jgi:hypothetical protein
MMRLCCVDGRTFATGEARFTSQRAHAADRLARIYLQVEIGTVHTEAVLDTGGAYLVLDPAMAVRAGIGPPVLSDRISIRGFVFTGTVHRIPVTIAADAGEPLTFEATAFVPELGAEEPWPLPSYLGWQGCLDRIRFAIDPRDERVYFGAAD